MLFETSIDSSESGVGPLSELTHLSPSRSSTGPWGIQDGDLFLNSPHQRQRDTPEVVVENVQSSGSIGSCATVEKGRRWTDTTTS